MAFFGLMTVKAHREQLGHLRGLADIRKTALTESDKTIGRIQRENARLLAELAPLKAERDGILRDKLNESARAKSLAAELAEAMKAIEALRPDAEKHRERLRRDRDSAAAKRALKAA